MILEKAMWLGLQHFAEGGEGSAGSEGLGTQTGDDFHGAADRGTGETSEENVVYGVVDEDDGLAAADENERAAEDGAGEHDNLEEEFKKLISKDGKFKGVFEKHMSNIVSERLRHDRERNERMARRDASEQRAVSEAQSSVFTELARQYKLEPTDYAGIAKALSEDTSRLEAEAAERGMSSDELSKVKQLELENSKYKQADAKRQAAAVAQRKAALSEQRYRSWVSEGEELRKLYPAFDLETEAKNPEFIKGLKSGMPMRMIYEGMHHAELLTSAMAKTAERVEKGVVDKQKANLQRPVEGGTASRASTVHKSRVEDLTNEDIQNIVKRVEAGERISFNPFQKGM